MIGYSMYARRLYHKVRETNVGLAKCDATSMDMKADDSEEEEVRQMHPNLKRCLGCWPPDGRYIGPPEGE